MSLNASPDDHANMLSRGQSLGNQMDRDTTKFGDRRENGQPSQDRADDRGSTLPTMPNRAEVIVKILVTPSRVGAAAKQVNLPNCVAVIRKGPPHVMVDSVSPSHPRPHILG